jgi:N-acetylmuramate 1-kinase
MINLHQETTENLLYTIDAWVKSHITKNYTIKPIEGDAGARKYWRITTKTTSYILAHDPNISSLNQYIAYAKELAKYKIKTPKIKAYDLQKQLLLQEDFGDQLLITKTITEEKEYYYEKSILEIIKLQQIPQDQAIWGSYCYDKLITEMNLTPEWYSRHHCKTPLNQEKMALFTDVCHDIAIKILKQPTALVHRDFHSRNLLITTDSSLGVIDFQDALIGPISYDLASLLRDYYSPLSRPLLQKLQKFYLNAAISAGIIEINQTEFNKMFHITALQRHLKVLGIFCRLCYRDNKKQYLPYLPTVAKYIKDAVAELPEYEILYELIPLQSVEQYAE